MMTRWLKCGERRGQNQCRWTRVIAAYAIHYDEDDTIHCDEDEDDKNDQDEDVHYDEDDDVSGAVDDDAAA